MPSCKSAQQRVGHMPQQGGTRLALGPGGLASMPPRKPAAKDTGSGMRPTSALMRNQVGSVAAATQAPTKSGIHARRRLCSACPIAPPPMTPTPPPRPQIVSTCACRAPALPRVDLLPAQVLSFAAGKRGVQPAVLLLQTAHQGVDGCQT